MLFTDFSSGSTVIRLVNFVVFGVLSYVIFALLNILDFFKVWHSCSQTRQHDEEVVSGRVFTQSGSPGTGKSFSMTYDICLLAENIYEDLKFDYLHGLAKRELNANYIAANAADELLYEAKKDSFLFYKNGKGIPCVCSNYGIQNKYTFEFSYSIDEGHLAMDKRLPEKSCLALDEVCDFLSNKRSTSSYDAFQNKKQKEENIIYDEFFSKERHFADLYMILSDQDNGEVYKGVRRVVVSNRRYTKMERILEPRLIGWLLGKIRDRVIKRYDKKDKGFTKRLLRLYDWLKLRFSRIGFFKFNYETVFDPELSGKEVETGTMILPKNVNFVYNDRAYFLDYKALDKPLELEPHKSLFIQDM